MPEINSFEADWFMICVNLCDNHFQRYVAVKLMHIRLEMFRTLGRKAAKILSTPDEELKNKGRQVRKAQFISASRVAISELP